MNCPFGPARTGPVGLELSCLELGDSNCCLANKICGFIFCGGGINCCNIGWERLGDWSMLLGGVGRGAGAIFWCKFPLTGNGAPPPPGGGGGGGGGGTLILPPLFALLLVSISMRLMLSSSSMLEE